MFNATLMCLTKNNNQCFTCSFKSLESKQYSQTFVETWPPYQYMHLFALIIVSALHRKVFTRFWSMAVRIYLFSHKSISGLRRWYQGKGLECSQCSGSSRRCSVRSRLGLCSNHLSSTPPFLHGAHFVNRNIVMLEHDYATYSSWSEGTL